LIVLHKTRGQIHALCTVLIQGYLAGIRTIRADKLRRNMRKDITLLRSPGNYHGTGRNQCTHSVDLMTISVPDTLPIHTDIFRVKYVIQSPITFFCPNKECGNVVDVDPLYESNCLLCAYCDTKWCRQCLVTPYHDGKSCIEHEVESKQDQNAVFIWEMNRQGKVKFCPTCKSPIFRDGGCNKMICKSCHTKFCWICRTTGIDYDHYSGDSDCANKLWEGTGEV